MKILCICLILVLRGILIINPPIRTIYIIPIQSPSSVVWDTKTIYNDVLQATLFWKSIEQFNVIIQETVIYTDTLDGRDGFGFTSQYRQTDGITLFIIDNNDVTFCGYSFACSSPSIKTTWAQYGTGLDFQATIAHELGHTAFNLPHQYQDTYDIMGLTPDQAYSYNSIGCSSLALLERPCHNTYLPQVLV